MSNSSSISQTNAQPKATSVKQLDYESTYHIDGKIFIVTPVFRQNGAETLGSALLKLIQTELTKC